MSDFFYDKSGEPIGYVEDLIKRDYVSKKEIVKIIKKLKKDSDFQDFGWADLDNWCEKYIKRYE